MFSNSSYLGRLTSAPIGRSSGPWRCDGSSGHHRGRRRPRGLAHGRALLRLGESHARPNDRVDQRIANIEVKTRKPHDNAQNHEPSKSDLLGGCRYDPGRRNIQCPGQNPRPEGPHPIPPVKAAWPAGTMRPSASPRMPRVLCRYGKTCRATAMTEPWPPWRRCWQQTRSTANRRSTFARLPVACGLNLDGPFFVEQQYVVVRSPHAAWNNDGCFLGRRWKRASSYRLSRNTTRFWGDQYPVSRVEERQEDPRAAVRPRAHHRVHDPQDRR